MAPAPVTTVTRGRSNPVNLRFRVGAGFHVNSNQPKSEFLIPTVLKLSAPTDIVIGRVTYPAGTDMSFAFAPEDKLSVYTGEFPVVVEVRPLADVIPAKYMIRGELKYQACDRAACYPPKKLQVQFEVKVVKAPSTAPQESRTEPARALVVRPGVTQSKLETPDSESTIAQEGALCGPDRPDKHSISDRIGQALETEIHCSLASRYFG